MMYNVNLLLIVALVAAALWTVMTARLLRAVVALAVTSVLITVLMFQLRAPIAGVFELSVCAGLIPAIQGTTATDPIAQDLLSYAATKSFTRYPMIDNVIQPEVQSVASTVLVAAFAGTMSTQDALQKMQDALNALPADRRSTTYK